MDNIFGVTPIESAYEVIGLTNNYVITTYLFRESPWGSLFFTTGFFIALSKFYSSNNFMSLGKFFIVSFLALMLFILPVSNISNISSSMEKAGNFDQIKANDVFTSGTKNDNANAVLTFFSRLYNNLILGTIDALDKVSGKDGYSYLQSPFLMNKIMLQMQNFLKADISDPALRNSVENFIDKHYLPTLNKMEEKGIIKVDNIPFLWPGSQLVIDHYSDEGKQLWPALHENLKTYVRKSGVNNRYQKYEQQVNVFFNQNNIINDHSLNNKDDKLILFLLNENYFSSARGSPTSLNYKFTNTGKNAEDAFSKNWQAGMNKLGWVIARFGDYFVYIFSSAGLQFFLTALPYLQGLLVLLLFSLFPAILVLCITTSSIKSFTMFLKTLFYIKSWHLILAIISNGSSYVLDVQARLMPSSDFLIERPIFNIITFLFLITSPALSYFLINGSMEGIGLLTTGILGVGGAATGNLYGKLQRIRNTTTGGAIKRVKGIFMKGGTS